MRTRAALALPLVLLFPLAVRSQTGPTTRVVDPAYVSSFRAFYDYLGQVYPCFEMKGINWKKVGEELLPRAGKVKTDAEFGLLCMELIAKLQDSHAQLIQASAKLPEVPGEPTFDPGFACLSDDRGRPVIYCVERNSPAERAGLHPGQTVISVNDKPAEEAVKGWMKLAATYEGYSSERVLRYDAVRCFHRQMKSGTVVEFVIESADGTRQRVEMPATVGGRYLPRLPVPIEGINDSADIGWKRLGNDVGYIYVRRIRNGLIGDLDVALEALKGVRGLIIDVRGNLGGGFDAERSFRNFDVGDKAEPNRPRFTGPIAMLIDERCISAGEGWTSWFVAKKRARLFGATTAGASSRKDTYTMANGLYRAIVPVKAYTGFLDRPIERRGIEPDVPVRCTAKDLDAGVDTVLEAARKYLLSLPAGGL